MFGTMTSKWQDAAMQAFLFDDLQHEQADKGSWIPAPTMIRADETNKDFNECRDSGSAYRGRIIHLFSLLHAVATLNLTGISSDCLSAIHGEETGDSCDGHSGKHGQGILFLPDPSEMAAGSSGKGYRENDWQAVFTNHCAMQTDWLDKLTSSAAGSDSDCAPCCDSYGDAEQIKLDRVMLVQGLLSREIHIRQTQGGLACSPPILSRFFQVLSDGHLGYSHCEKILESPFPFPYSQLITFLLLVHGVLFPVMCVAYIKNFWIGMPCAFVVSLAYHCVETVARQLENPFSDTPNAVRVTKLHCHFIFFLKTLESHFGQHPKTRRRGFITTPGHGDLRRKATGVSMDLRVSMLAMDPASASNLTLPDLPVLNSVPEQLEDELSGAAAESPEHAKMK